MYQLLVKNGHIVDGTGNPWFRADLVVENGKIVALGHHITENAEHSIDASGLIVAPGFIDLHTHSDSTILTNNRATSSIMAGVTTEAVGNCGGSIYGFTPTYLETLQKRHRNVEISWTDLKGYREQLSKKGIGINIAPFVGHNTVRASVMGPEGKGGERIIPTEDELSKMEQLVGEAMEQGAFGMTTGLGYPPGRNALPEEVVRLCRVVVEHGGAYMSHIRDPDGALIEAVREFIETCEKAGIRGSMSHHKCIGPENWGKPNETVRLFERARQRGVEVIYDQYPWNYSSAANLGRWFISGWGRNQGIEGHYVPAKLDLATLLSDLRNPELWSRIKREAQERYEVEAKKNEERRRTMEKYNLAASETVNPKNFEYITSSKTHPELVGKRFFEVAEALGMDDYWEAIRKVLIDDDGETFTGGGGICEEDIATILRYPACAVSTDSSTRDMPSTVMRPAHPRNYGTYAKVLQHYVREVHLLSLEDAIRKMTSLPAGFLGLTDRGLIRLGSWADLTVFDSEQVENKATFAEPDRFPTGIEYVIVNGEIVAEKGKRTESLPGKVLDRTDRQ